MAEWLPRTPRSIRSRSYSPSKSFRNPAYRKLDKLATELVKASHLTENSAKTEEPVGITPTPEDTCNAIYVVEAAKTCFARSPAPPARLSKTDLWKLRRNLPDSPANVTFDIDVAPGANGSKATPS
jgi:hypothetical protein